MMPQNTEKKLENILDFSEMLKLFKYFSSITGVDMALYDSDGAEKLSYRKDKGKCICNLVGANDECRFFMKYAAEKAAELGEPYIFKCGCVIKCSVPVIFEDKPVGSVAFGPLLLWEADEIAREELRRFIKIRAPKINNIDEVIGYFKQLDPDTMTSAAQILFITVNNLSKAESKYLNERNKIYNQQRSIGDAIIDHKRSGPCTPSYCLCSDGRYR
jgi:two-component system response regulator YesN